MEEKLTGLYKTADFDPQDAMKRRVKAYALENAKLVKAQYFVFGGLAAACAALIIALMPLLNMAGHKENYNLLRLPASQGPASPGFASENLPHTQGN